MRLHNLCAAVLVALMSCSTSGAHVTFQGIPETEIVDGRLELRGENGLLVAIWPTENGLLRQYAALDGAPAPDGRSVQLPMMDYMLVPDPAAETAITTIATSTALPPSYDFQGEEPADLADISYQIGDYVITPVEGGALFSLHGEVFLLQQYRSQSGRVIVDTHLPDAQLWHGLGGISHSADLSGVRARIKQRAAYADQTYLHVPFVFGSRGSGLYYNAGSSDMAVFAQRGSGKMSYRSGEQYNDSLIWHTPSPRQTVASFYKLSNSQSLLPRWAFGYIQSKYGYRTQDEVYEVVEQFQELGIPLSAIILDLYWFRNMGDFDWDREAFPNPDELIEFLDARDIRLITITEPYMTVDSLEYDTFVEQDLLVRDQSGDIPVWSSWWTFDSPGGSMIDMAADGIQDTLGSLYVGMMEQGIDAFWTDLGEPEEVPPGAVFGSYTAEQFHNYYNREWSRIIYEEVSAAFPERRFWNLTRSGFTGSASYNTSVWSGDVRSSFDALSVQPALGTGSGLTGFSYWGSDVGGFESSSQPPEQELFIRWMQFGLFSPVFRAHGSQSPREPWIHDDAATAVIRSAIRLRHTLIPYIYSTAFQTFRDGIPMMRPLYFSDTQESWDSEESGWLYRNSESYMFGDSLLIRPITEPMSEQPVTSVRLPPGEWYDFFSLQAVGEGIAMRVFELHEYPVFIRSGGIIPMDRQFDGQVDSMILIPDEQPSSFTWYNDDGVSQAYLDGENETIEITMSAEGIGFSGVQEPRSFGLIVPLDRMPSGFRRAGGSGHMQIQIPRGDSFIEWEM